MKTHNGLSAWTLCAITFGVGLVPSSAHAGKLHHKQKYEAVQGYIIQSQAPAAVQMVPAATVLPMHGSLAVQGLGMASAQASSQAPSSQAAPQALAPVQPQYTTALQAQPTALMMPFAQVPVQAAPVQMLPMAQMHVQAVQAAPVHMMQTAPVHMMQAVPAPMMQVGLIQQVQAVQAAPVPMMQAAPAIQAVPVQYTAPMLSGPSQTATPATILLPKKCGLFGF